MTKTQPVLGPFSPIEGSPLEDELKVRAAGPGNLLRLPNRLRRSAIEFYQKDSHSSWARAKLVMRGLVYGPWTAPWLEFLETESMRPLVRSDPTLYIRVQWPYLNRGYGPAKRLDFLRHHYRFLFQQVAPSLRSQLLAAPHLTLASWNVPELGLFSLRLSHANKFGQEGEMVLSLHQEPERLCQLICFSVTGASHLSIGCLQGGRHAAGEAEEISNREFNVTLTRRLHGVRPKNLVLFALRQLAAVWSIEQLRGVSNPRQIFRQNVQTDYDLFWTEAGATLASDGMYELPAQQPERSPESIPAKKRAMYRRRYEFLSRLGQEIQATLTSPQRLIVPIETT